MEKLVYTGRDGGTRLDAFILQQMPGLGPGILHKYLRQNKIKLNGKKQPLSTRLYSGDEVALFLPLNATAPPALQVLYEDEHLLAVNKPAGLASMGGDESLDVGAARTALAAIRRYLEDMGAYVPGAGAFRPVLCHRLDTGTSGVLLAAKTAAGERFAQDLIRNHRLTKEYLCVTVGHPQPPVGKLAGWLAKDSHTATVKVYSQKRAGAKPARLSYATLEKSGPLALVRVGLVTGRTHQIRAQLAAAGTPLLGDSKYGNLKENRRWRCKYQCLCAYALRFPTDIEDAAFAHYAGLVVQCAEPWFVAALQNGELGGGR